MARPITWRNIAGPSFNNSALGQGIDAFRSAGAGFSDLTESLFKTQDRIDAGYTNQGIRQALATGRVDPTLNPRADTTAVYEALLGKKKADSDLKTAAVGRDLTREQTKETAENAARLALNNAPEWRNLERQEKEAQIARWEALSANERAQLGINQEKLEMLRSQAARDEETRAAQARAEELFGTLTQEYTAEEQARNLELQQAAFGPQIAARVAELQEAGASPEEIQAEVILARQTIEDRMRMMNQDARSAGFTRAVEDIALTPGFAAQLGLSGADFATTTPGQASASLQAQASARQDAINAAQAELQTFQLDTARNAAAGNATYGVILDDAGNPRLAQHAGERDGNKLTKGQWDAEIERAGLSDRLEDVSQDAFNIARGNRSLLQNVLKQGKKLTAQGFLDQVQLAQDDIVRFAQDERVAALQSQIGVTDLDLPGARRAIVDDSLDQQFLAGAAEPTASSVTSTDDPQLKRGVVAALREIQDLRRARPDMDPRQARILNRFENIFLKGSLSEGYRGVSDRLSRTAVFDDSEIRDELEEWNEYQRRNGYK